MKKFILITATLLLTLSLLAGCSKPQAELPVNTEPSSSAADSVSEPTEESTEEPTEEATEEPTEEPTEEATEEPSEEPTEAPTEPKTEPTTKPTETAPVEKEEDTEREDDIRVVYAKQIERYYTALSQKWDESAYFEHEMSPLAVYYGLEGNAFDNVGFAFMDLDGDGSQELIIGAIQNAGKDPLVFEIWTLKANEPVMLAQSGARNRYYLQYAEEDALWSVAYEGENGAANHAVHYLQLLDGELKVVQGIIFDAVANENDPWFMTYDLDWDVSNDTPIDEETANAVMDAERNHYAAAKYIPYSQYK